MESGFQLPPPDLDTFIERFWWWRSRPGETVVMPLLAPGVGAELFLHFGQPFRWKGLGLLAEPGTMAQLIAVRQGPLDFAPRGDLDFLAVRFRAGALRHFIPCPPGEIQDDRMPAEDLWGPSMLGLLDRLTAMPSLAARVDSLCVWLREARAHGWRPDHGVDAAMAALYEHPGVISLEALAEGAGLGPRQFQRRFKAAHGISPKRFPGLVRLYRLVRREILEPHPTYLDSALDLGYFDQAHVIHAFQTLLGATPKTFLNEAKARTHFYNPSRKR